MNIKSSPSGKWFEDQYSLTDLLSLSVAVNRINEGYIKKDAHIEWKVFLDMIQPLRAA